MELTAERVQLFTERRRRVAELASRYPFARETLGLYGALLEVQGAAFEAAVREPPAPAEVAAYAAARVLPDVIRVTAAAGPDRLVRAAVARFDGAGLDAMVAAWFHGADQPPVDRYLARAAAEPVLAALGPAVEIVCSGPKDDRHCPRCGGLPQVSYTAPSEDPLVTGPRHLQCARCQSVWAYSRMTCAGCGEDAPSQLPIYSEHEHFPQARVDACLRCRRFIVSVDLRLDPGAVPAVDELAALPLDLYARDRGMTKIIPNLMGF